MIAPKNDIGKEAREKIEQVKQKPIKLGLWGTTGAGKTTYLTMLYQWLRQDDEHWDVKALGEEARKFVDDNFKYIEQGHVFPPATMKTDLEVLSYILSNTSSSGVTSIKDIKVILEFIDAPGEVYETLKDSAQTYGKINNQNTGTQYNSILEYFNQCDGIIFLIDSELPENKKPLVLSSLRFLFHTLQPEQRLVTKVEKFISFCVTKIDQKGLIQDKNAPFNLVQRILGEKAITEFNNDIYCNINYSDDYSKNRCSFFGISSIGMALDNIGGLVSVVEESQQFSQSQEVESVSNSLNQSSSNTESSTDTKNDGLEFGFPAELGSKKSEVSSYNSLRKIDYDKFQEAKPINVIEPVEWLITSILKYRIQEALRG